METLIVHPESREKITALKAFLKALKIKFEVKEVPYNPDFLEKIQKGDEDIKAGRTTKVTLDQIWK